MISVMFAYEGGYLTVVFPCTETELTTKLNDFDFGFDIHNMWVHAFVEPKEFAPMEQQAHDLDELNYLAKRMDSFVDTERRRFFAAVAHEKIYQIPDLISPIPIIADIFVGFGKRRLCSRRHLEQSFESKIMQIEQILFCT